MATYAAFKHVELYNVGKTKKRVLRPPGGGTSDIFGGDLPQTPRNVKNHMQSNIFSCDKNGAIKNNVRQGAHRFYFIGDQPRRGQQKVDSYQRLFGEPERPNTPARNHMKSSIPFGSNTEAAQELLANGNGHHSNGKGGSVSTSTSSSVSSSTENLKMNGVSKLVFRKMSKTDEACPPLPVPESSSPPNSNTPQLSIDLPCEPKASEQTDSSDLSARSRVTVKDTNLSARSELSEHPQATSRSKVPTTDHAQRFSSASKHSNMGAGDVASQTRREIGTNSDNPHSFTKTQPGKEGRQEVLEPCDNRVPPAPTPRNPITGLGLGEDGVGGIKPKKPKDRRDGNPVTGEGYKPSNSFNNAVPTLNGANQVINKNRIPPGGFSSGLW
ncbi:microtubule-associated protein Jupiter isoform X2 [Bactrocera dorsalis]|uniref:Microtubule-associated protein Jupiter n=1 Tax=Bactrocera dorsalis TaxID=27457 RepID=A0A8N4L136_BACDO|nr:microtubule-associated protein Jupiter isoform X2 [Bactrocera dorsalis]XP_029404986.2 microtubule-associated protein Jupiter isoform X2 [Bactrocera dorsalis]